MNKIVKNNTTQQLDGNVVVKVKQGNKTIKKVKIHNTATLNLLYGLLLSLSNNIDQTCLPRYLGVGTDHSPSTPEMTGLQSEVTRLRTPVIPNYKGAPKKNQNGSATVTCQGILPYENLGIYTGISEIGLFGTQTGSSLVARIQLYDSSKQPEEQNLISVGVGQSLVVEWTFSIQNIQ